MRGGLTIDLYLARLIAVPLVGTLVLAAMLLVLDKMLRLFDFVVSEGGPVDVVWKMLANLLPEYLALGIPIGLLLGILLAFRKLALSSELDALRGVGLSYARLLRVPYLFTLVLMGLNLAIVGYLQPRAHYLYDQLRYELRSGALGASIKVGEFTDLGDNMTLRIEGSRNEGQDLFGIFLMREDEEAGRNLAVSAERGSFLATDDPDVILLRLANGRLVHDAPDYASPRVLSFESHDLPIDLPGIERFRTRGEGTVELTLPELVRAGSDAADPVLRAQSRANFHYRLAEIVMMLLLPLLAVALAVPPKRSSSGLGIFLSIVMVVTYHKINQSAEQMAAQGRIDPVLALWTPFAVFALLIVWMFWTLAYRPGGQPIGALERWFAKIGRLLALLLRFGRRKARTI
ncbi:MAG: LPS export ABC transporter permease LptF [Sphingomonadaceae bacterium]